MKLKQKLLKTTLLLFLVAVLLPLFVTAQKVKAASGCPPEKTVCSNEDITYTANYTPPTFKMSADKQIIHATFYSSLQEAGREVTFFFDQPNIGGYVDYLAVHDDNGPFCSGMSQQGGVVVSISSFDKPGTKTIDGLMDVDWYEKSTNKCNDYSGPGSQDVFGVGKGLVKITIDVSAVTPGGGSPGTTGDNEACFASSWEWSWAVCPIINAAQTTANALYGFVEDQLKFTILQSCPEPTTAANCTDSLGASHGSVHDAWNNFRILVSGLVVILLLVMVISQAIGSGPFDAYTVKKMLPRLVMGVILIQVSWPVFAYVINVVDRLGIGLADLMYAPFGGASKMDLYSLLSPFGTGAVAFNWVGLGALVIFGVVAPFVVLGMILAVLAALFAGFLTLLFRKILIILALILVPVALISWMMPSDGLRIYWKKWWENFSKALMMFPIIIAIIAAGRIFAKIGGAQIDFVGFFIVLVGFFGPLFLLPKTFKWGGTVMQTVGSGIQKAQERGLKRPKEFLGERQKGYSAERARQSQERYTRGVGFGFNRNWRTGFGIRNVPGSFREHGASLLWRRPVDLVRSGTVDPTVWGRRREEAIRGYRAAGAESEEKEMQQADRDFGILASLSENHDDFAAQVGGADVGETITFNDRFGNTRRLGVTRAMKRAGMNGIAKFGTDNGYRTLAGILNELNHGDAEDQFMAERFRDANVATLKPKMDYLYRGQSREVHGSDERPDWVIDPTRPLGGRLAGPIVSRIDALAPGHFVQMEAPDLEALLSGLSEIANNHPNANARAEAVRYLGAINANWESAIDNGQIAPNIGPSVNLAMKAFHDGTFLGRRNDDRTAAGLTTQIELVPGVSSAALGGRVSTEGVVT